MTGSWDLLCFNEHHEVALKGHHPISMPDGSLEAYATLEDIGGQCWFLGRGSVMASGDTTRSPDSMGNTFCRGCFEGALPAIVTSIGRGLCARVPEVLPLPQAWVGPRRGLQYLGKVH